MVHVLVRHKVSDYNRWKEAFDSHLNARKRAGETGFRLFHNVEDMREIFLLLDWQSVEEARKFMTSDGAAGRHGRKPASSVLPKSSIWKMRAASIAPRPISNCRNS